MGQTKPEWNQRAQTKFKILTKNIECKLSKNRDGLNHPQKPPAAFRFCVLHLSTPRVPCSSKIKSYILAENIYKVTSVF